MNIVKPIEAYDRGVCPGNVCLTCNKNLATQPCEIGLRIGIDQSIYLLLCEKKALAAIAALRVRRDNVEAFRVSV